MSAPKTVSVLIPTLGREKELLQTVDLLMNQSVAPLEILVVDQNDPPIPSVDAALARNPLVRHLRSPKKGISINYNLLLQQARGEVVLYLDDDVIPTKHLIANHLARYQEKIGGVAGRVFQPSGDLPEAKIRAVGKYCRLSGKTLAHFNSGVSQDVDFSQGCNMSYLREALLSIGGFDVGFSGNGYFFETDGGLRLKQKGYRIRFDPYAELKHLAASSGGARVPEKWRHSFYFVHNGLRLYRRHSPRWALPFYVSKLFFYLCAKAAFNRDVKIFTQGMVALREGLSQSMEFAGSVEVPDSFRDLSYEAAIQSLPGVDR